MLGLLVTLNNGIKYDLVEFLGSGGQAVAFKGTPRSTNGRDYAFKIYWHDNPNGFNGE